MSRKEPLYPHVPKSRVKAGPEYGKELIHGCAILPSPLGPTYVPLVLESETIGGAPTGHYTIKEALRTLGDTPDEAFDKAHKRILEMK